MEKAQWTSSHKSRRWTRTLGWLQARRGRALPVVVAVAVFAIAIALRLPSCSESFWLDELHSAWSVWSDFGQVYPRAAAGNQTPFYFWGLWVWKQVAGESEIALRASSVVAVAAACAVVTLGVTRTTQKLIAGTLAGVLLAVESNSIFFGTELRPYPFVILGSSIAIWLAIEARWVWLVFVCCITTLIHPTSAGVLAFLIVGAVVSSETMLGNRLKSTRQHTTTSDPARVAKRQRAWVAVTLMLVVTVIALWNSSLTDTWNRREQWRTFGQASRLTELWQIWPWIPICIAPFCAFVVSRYRSPERDAYRPWLVPLAAGLLATLTFFFVSYVGWLSLWQRRYFIAVLPMLVWSAGVLAGQRFPCRQRVWRNTIGITTAGGIVVALMWQQGILAKAAAGDVRLTGRGEGWREAIAWIDGHEGDAFVLIDSGLIESRVLQTNKDELSRDMLAYLVYPVSGPYSVRAAHPIAPLALLPSTGIRQTHDASASSFPAELPPWMKYAWIVTRSPPPVAQSFLQRMKSDSFLADIASQADGRSFGNITVLRFRIAATVAQ